jgi:hypothetical protein
MAEASRAEHFLEEFASLEAHMRRNLGRDQSIAYTRLVSEMRSRGFITDSQDQALRTFGYLRNALAHAGSSGGEVIADPRQSAVDEFNLLSSNVKSPPLLVDVVRHKVMYLDVEAPLNAFMLLVKTRDFSQVPIVENGRYIDMLTLGRLARWIAENRHYDWFNLQDTSVREVLKVELQSEESFAECAPEINLAQALNHFDLGSTAAFGEDHVPVRGLIVLGKGPAVDELRALVTFEDLPVMLRALGRGA